MLNAFTTGEISFNLAKNNVGDTFRERYFYISHRDRLLLAVVEHSYELLSITIVNYYSLLSIISVNYRQTSSRTCNIFSHLTAW